MLSFTFFLLYELLYKAWYKQFDKIFEPIVAECLTLFCFAVGDSLWSYPNINCPVLNSHTCNTRSYFIMYWLESSKYLIYRLCEARLKYCKFGGSVFKGDVINFCMCCFSLFKGVLHAGTIWCIWSLILWVPQHVKKKLSPLYIHTHCVCVQINAYLGKKKS